MRKVILLMHASLDGFVGGPDGELDWVRHGDDIFQYVTDHFSGIDTAIYGRVTYGMMESYWPTVPSNPDSTEQELHHSEWVENINKVVISRSLENVSWNNTVLIRDNVKEEIEKLKQLPGKDMMIFGSPSITRLFMELDLIDEYLINVNPVVLGRGIPLFQDVREKISLQLLKATTFEAGVVGLHYERV
jgi:dihydrofolate reductase